MQLKAPFTFAFAAPNLLTTSYRNLSSPVTSRFLHRSSSFTLSITKLFSTVTGDSNQDHDDDGRFLGAEKKKPSTVMDYVNSIRPVTLLQAVGGFWIGYLILRKTSPSVPPPNNIIQMTPLTSIAISLSIFLSYGCGMVLNDLKDRTLDASDSTNVKAQRPIAAGRITPQAGWIYAGGLSLTSLLLSVSCNSSCSQSLFWWTASNLLVMVGYAIGGWQNILLLKNLLCGWLAISPLVGASLWYHNNNNKAAAPWCYLPKTLQPFATAGFAAHVAREIVKDMEDVTLDARGPKTTLPMVLGMQWSQRLAYGIVFGTYAKLIGSPSYWNLMGAKSSYAVGLACGVVMCLRASRMERIEDGQRLLKKSIFVLLAGMIGGLWI